MRRGLAFRFSALILSVAGLVFALMSLIGYGQDRATLLRNAERGARIQAQALVQRIESRLAPIPRVPQGVAYELEDGTLAGEGILRRQRQVLADNDAIYGMAVAFEPKGPEPEPAPYTFRTPLGPESTRLGGPGYRYQYMDWYQLPRELGATVWTEPYFDEGGGGIVMTTCSVPFFNRAESMADEREVAGVVTADVSLEWLRRLVAGVSILETGYAYVITRNGTYVTHPEAGVPFNETIFTRAETFGSDELRRIGRRMVQGKQGLEAVRSLHTGKSGFLVFAPLPTTGWSLAVFYPEDELLADVSRQALVNAALGGGGFVVLFGLVVLLAGSVTRPLRRLSEAAREVAGGNLEADLPAVAARDEVRDLSLAFRHMQASLKEHIRNLTEATASRERMQSELRIAREIQMGILPKDFAPLAGGEVDLFALLEPAREVGGDFYDIFSCGPGRLCLLVGDVSGKGVPAALFMAVAKTLLKAVSGPDPAQTLARAGDEMAQANDSCMFATVFCAVLDLKGGELRYASAGHNPPLLLCADGGARYLASRGEPVAGAMPGVTYTADTLALKPGDTLLVYTDGVTEAMDPEGGLFGEDRLLRRAASLAGEAAGAEALCRALAAEVRVFARGAEQSDDITMLALRFPGPGNNPG